MVSQLKKEGANKLFSLGLVLFAISPILPFNFRNSHLVILLISAIIMLSFKTGKRNSIAFKQFMINGSLFMLMLISLLYTKNSAYGVERLMGMISLLVMPFVFYVALTQIDYDIKKIHSKIISLYFFSNIIFFLVFILVSYFKFENFFQHTPEFFNSKLGRYSIHPQYASLNLIISLILSLSVYQFSKSALRRTLVVVCSILALMFLFVFSRKLTVILIPILFFIYLFFSSFKSRKLYFLILFLVLVATTFLIEPIKERYMDFYNLTASFSEVKSSSIVQRIRLFECSIQAISLNPIFGIGIGDVKALMELCETGGQTKFFNSHNQFLGVWLSSGIMGLLALLTIIYTNLIRGLRTKDIIYVLTTVSFVFIMLVENYLERQDGVLSATFFINYLAFLSLKNNMK